MLYPLIISLVAGLSTSIGIIFTYLNPKNINKFICISLSFAFGVMVLLSIKELIPIPLKNILIFNEMPCNILIMVIIPFVAFKLINIGNIKIKNSNSLYKVGVLSMISLLLHNIPEGIITFVSGITNMQLGLKLGLAIMAHNIPEGICISIPIYYATQSRGRAFIMTLIAGLSEPIGGLTIYLLFKNYLNLNILNILLYFVGILMILISICNILPEIIKYKKIIWIIYGILLSLFILIL